MEIHITITPLFVEDADKIVLSKISLDDLTDIIKNCKHPMDVESLKKIRSGIPGTYYVSDKKNDYNILINGK